MFETLKLGDAVAEMLIAYSLIGIASVLTCELILCGTKSVCMLALASCSMARKHVLLGCQALLKYVERFTTLLICMTAIIKCLSLIYGEIYEQRE